MTEDEFGLRVVRALGFTAANRDARIHWMQDPEAGAVVREDAQRSLQKVLAHRLWTDLRRGWRYTNPSLSVLKLIDVEFIGLDDIAEDGMKLIEEIMDAWMNYGFETQVLVASTRHPRHIVDTAKLGAHIATVPYDVFKKLPQSRPRNPSLQRQRADTDLHRR
jgi:hypothetical protein